ncbi:MAG: hypothetical protein ACI85O_000273 [Saprospiraceae bacterium]|jgi:hypothetical protein
MSLIHSFFVALTSLFTEIFTALQNTKSNFSYSFSRNSKIPIIRMFHEALKAEN